MLWPRDLVWLMNMNIGDASLLGGAVRASAQFDMFPAYAEMMVEALAARKPPSTRTLRDSDEQNPPADSCWEYDMKSAEKEGERKRERQTQRGTLC